MGYVLLAEAVAASPVPERRWRPFRLRHPFRPKGATVLAPVKDASRRCCGGLSAILDRIRARRLAGRQVGTKRQPSRSNKGMAVAAQVRTWYALQAAQKPRQFHFKRRGGKIKRLSNANRMAT